MFEKIEDYLQTLVGFGLYFFVYKNSCYWSKEKTESYQFRHLKKLLLSCEKDVPYYRDLFSKIGFDVKRDFKSLSDLSIIPITTKEQVRENPNLFINPKYKTKALITYSSGSTGNPMKYYISRNQKIVENAVIWRHWFWGGYRFRDKMAIVRSFAPKDGVLIKMDRIRNFRYYSPFHLSDENIKMYLEDMIAHNVHVLRGYPSSIRALADYVLKTNCDIPHIKLVLTASEVLSNDDRAIIEHAFACKVSNYYGLAEVIVTMGDCEKHNGLHNYDEYGYLELLDSGNGKNKRVIGTNLHNYAMPLLRYDTMDLAEYDGHACGCGRNLIVVNNIIGRSNSVLKFSGISIPLTNFYTVLEYYPNLLSWQIIQIGADRVELRVSGTYDEKSDTKIKEEFKVRLPENVAFSIVYNASFIKKYEGKKPPFIYIEDEIHN